MKYITKLNRLLFLSIVAVLLVLPAVSFAAEGFGYKGYKIITSIPGTNIVAGQSIDGITIASYIATIYRGGLALVGFVAFVMIVFWGVMYTVSGGNTSKTAEAKTGITQALLGLVLLLAGFLVLQFINPALVNIQQLDNALNNLPKIDIKDPGGTQPQTKILPNIPDYSNGDKWYVCSYDSKSHYNTLNECGSACVKTNASGPQTKGDCTIATGALNP